jgi:hypothetical protein
MPDGREHLVAGQHEEVGAERGDVDRHVRARLSAVDQDEGTDLAGPADQHVDRVLGPEDVADVHEGQHLGALVHQQLEVGEVEPAVVGQRDPAQRGAGALAEHLPRHQVGVVLHLGDADLVAGADREAAARGGVAEGVGHQVVGLGGVLGEHHLVAVRRADEAGDGVAGRLVAVGRLLAQRVHAAVHVAVVLLHEAPLGVEHLRRLVRGRGVVEVDERVAVDLAGQHREVGSARRRRRSRSLPAGRSCRRHRPGDDRTHRQRAPAAPAASVRRTWRSRSLQLVGQLGPPCSTILPLTKTCTKSGWMYCRIACSG